MGLRNSLKDSIKHVHSEVEDIQIMKDYSSGRISSSNYETLLHKMYELWSESSPQIDRLPGQFQQFLVNYLESIGSDCKVQPRPAKSKKTYNEFSFFYILLGSAMGASIIIKRYEGASLPHEHLVHLSKQARPLWATFLKKLDAESSGSDSDDIIRDSLNLFNDLKLKIQSGEVAVEA